MKNSTTAKYFALAALLMFVAATLQIVGERFIVGALLFGAEACFLSAAANYRKKDAEENRQSEEEPGSNES